MVTVFDEEKQNERLEKVRRQEEEDLAKILSDKYGHPFIDLTGVGINTDALRVIPEETARAARAAAFALVGHKLSLLVVSPTDEKIKELQEELQRRGFITNIFIGSRYSLDKALERYKEISASTGTHGGVVEISEQELSSIVEQIKNISQIKDLITSRAGDPHGVSKVLEVILGGAVSTDASDIHIEPQEEAVRLRYRLDGVLQDIAEVDHKSYKLLLSRIKLVSALKLNLKTAAQDGRFTIRLFNVDIEIRTSVLPGPYGESLVLRLLNPRSIQVELEDLGIETNLLDIIKREIAKPNGMLLTTGPTGSGKTTTLYSFLRRVNTPGIKIITIEDPIEYHLKDITQTQVQDDKGYTFVDGLRSALRQDPDIIMVGEIRDGETAKIAINASLTGHLVFSTLHTNNAAGTIPRLIDLGVNPKVISSALTVAMAQRLVRKLCRDCKKEDAPNAREKEIINKILKRIKEKRPDIASGLAEGKVWRAGACPSCHNTGYRGRVGIFEVILMDRAIEDIISKNPSEREIKQAALPQNILDMGEDGIMKLLKGVTSFDELERVVEVDNL